MSVVSMADAPEIEMDGAVFRPLAVPSRGTAELAVWTVTIPPGAQATPHIVSREEILIVRSGRAAGTVGGESVDAGPGQALIFPPDTPVSVANASATEPLEMLCCTSAGIKGTVGSETFPIPWAQ
ncbi:cupin domain-containing protein [Streptosporangiaceae bacterium NEAU-GS5]|nr:cupin domain-containing protein [Streptosporangiaceae bacterium NEAU-GS5]